MSRKTWKASQDSTAGMQVSDNYVQATVATALGITIDDSRLHDAMYDIDLCKQIYGRITNNQTIEGR